MSQQPTPTRTGSPLSGLRPGGGLAAKGNAQPATGKRSMTTSTVLVWWRALVVLACLAAAVIAPLVLNENRNSLLQVNNAAQQVMRLQAVKGDVLAAEASATQAMLLAGPDATPDDAYLELLGTAANQLTNAGAARPQDVDALANISATLVSYSTLLTEGMVTHSDSAMNRASQSLHGELVPMLDEQIANNVNWLEVSIGDQRWLSVLLALPIVLTIVAMVVVARRTRRVLNIGLVISLAINIAMWVIITQLVTTSAASVSAVQSSGVSQATAVGQAYASVAEAKSIEGRMLLGITSQSEGNPAYDAATAEASENLKQLPMGAYEGINEKLDQMIQTHDQLMAATPEDPNRPQLVQSAQQPYDTLISWLSDQSTQIGAGLNEQLTDHASTVRGALGGIAIGMVAAALAAAIGLSQPLRRYL